MEEIEVGREKDAVVPPKRVITGWRRFACGLWRLPEGDISAAYCADTFPKLKTFLHEGRLYTNCGSLFSTAIHSFVTAYPLIPPDEYHGPLKVQYSYEGEEGIYKQERWRLGPKVIFESSDPTIDEWIPLLRVLYADGGYFAAGVTYPEFLTERHSPKSPNEQAAHAAELALCEVVEMPTTQEEMKDFLAGLINPAPPIQPQLELAF